MASNAVMYEPCISAQSTEMIQEAAIAPAGWRVLYWLANQPMLAAISLTRQQLTQ